MKKIIILLLLCSMLSMPLMAVNRFNLSSKKAMEKTNIQLMAQIEDLQIGDEIRWIHVDGFQGWELINYETEQEIYEKEQIWKYTKFVFFTSMFIAGWNTRTDYGIIAGTGFLYFALNIEF